MEQIRKDQLKQISEKALPYFEGFNKAMFKYDITNILRKSFFLANVMHETGGMKWLEEIWGPTPTQQRYEGRLDLGNTEEGDGYRFRGRGAFMLTGRANYQEFSEAVGVDVVANPELVSEDPLAIVSAGWYWHTRNINPLADIEDHIAVTRKINGGTNGLDNRKQWQKKIFNILYEF